MPKRNDPIRLSRLNDGLNRFETEAKANQLVDGLDVYEDAGDLRRRPAFSAIAAGVPFWLPAGQTVVAHEEIGVSTTLHYDRVLTITGAQIGGTTHNVYIGCDNLFDGFDWCNVDTTPTAPTAHNYLTPYYWNGTAWTAIPSITDTTRERVLNGSNIWFQSLTRNGRVSFHRSSQMADWAATTVSSLSKYWIRLDLSGGALTGTGNLEIAAPGPKPFTLEPINTIFPARFRNSKDSLVIGCDRAGTVNLEPGAQVGVINRKAREATPGFLIGDEGSGVIGEVAAPAAYMRHSTWTGASSARQLPTIAVGVSGIWTGTAGGLGAMGTTTNTRITKLDQRYSWLSDDGAALPAQAMQWRGSAIRANYSPTGAGSADATTLRSTISFPTFGATDNIGIFNGCRLRVVAKGAGGTPLGEEREIVGQTTSQLIVHPHFSVAPDTDNYFDIIKPHSRIRMWESDRESLELYTNGEHYLEIRDGIEYAADSDIDNAVVHFRVGRHFPWQLRRGKFWTAGYDIVTRTIQMTNGYQLIEYDGEDFRPATALSDPDDARVKQLVGGTEGGDELLRTSHIAGSLLRKAPPKGQFLVNWASRWVMTASDTSIAWSFPGLDNDVWPAKFETVIRDRYNAKITSITVLNELLVVSTASSLFTAQNPRSEGGDIVPLPVISGSGFLSHRAVANITRGGSSVLVGPTADTLILFDGYNITNVFDDWRRIVPGGVNQSRLSESVGAVSLARGEYYLAFSGAGSDHNNYMLVYNFEKNRAWLWTTPWGGITSIARDFDEAGRERILFGTQDGHLAALTEALTDDGDAITGYAKSPNIHIAGAQTFAPTAILITAKETGATETLTVRTFLNEEKAPNQASTQALNRGSDLYGGTEVYGPATGSNVAAQFATAGLVTKKFMIPAGSRAQSISFEVRGTGKWRFRLAEMLVTAKGQRSA